MFEAEALGTTAACQLGLIYLDSAAASKVQLSFNRSGRQLGERFHADLMGKLHH